MNEKTKYIDGVYGENVFSIEVMRKYLSDYAYDKLCATVNNAVPLDITVADEIAMAMKKWAIEKGATHYTHWFQPLTGATAEKHDSFIFPNGSGKVIMQFSGKELIKGEPDASSFPSGGLRTTFEARGYTAWDPTSPAFIKESGNGAVLCIPSVFCSYHGEVLDKKTPLLRSIDALSTQLCRLGKLFGINIGKRPYATLGAEQEYFLIDKKYFHQRLDLMQTGRTLFGLRPAKHQQMEDHYFSTIHPRVIAFMDELDMELWRLGVPAKTRHNEVCPAQFEIAPVFEEQNLSIDHNMLVMTLLREVAERHGFVCLLHEKPFAGVNGSGKHNNWNVYGPDGKNWLMPGDNPHENAKFLTMICALIKAIDNHADLLLASVASAANDRRLGANEAPPAIISIFLGEQLTEIIEQLEYGMPKTSKKGGTIEIGVSSLPSLPRDTTDRNRTSSFAFTGNKFEFRAVGSSQNCADPNTVLNTIVAEALDEICSALEQEISCGSDFNHALQNILGKIVKQHKRIIFNGDNYSKEWIVEAKRRKLPNPENALEALKAWLIPENVKMFERYKVFSERELTARYEVYRKAYEHTVTIEAKLTVTMAITLIVPAAVEYLKLLSETIHATISTKGKCLQLKELFRSILSVQEDLLKNTKQLEKAIERESLSDMLAGMNKVRNDVDILEGMVSKKLWPLPSYAEMMYIE